MKLFRLKREPESGQEEKELVLDTDAEVQAEDRAEAEAPADVPTLDVPAQAPAPETPAEPPVLDAPAQAPAPETPAEAPTLEAPTQAPAPDTPAEAPILETPAQAPAPDTPAEAFVPTQEEAPTPEGDLLARIGAEASREVEAESGSPQEDDALDPDLVDIFREAKNEVVEITLASELEDIPMDDLLGEVVGLSNRLGVVPGTHPEPGAPEAAEPAAEPSAQQASESTVEPVADPSALQASETVTEPIADPLAPEAPESPAEPSVVQTPEPLAEPDEGGEVPEANGSPVEQVAAQSPAGFRRYLRHGLFGALVLATAIGGGLWGAKQFTRTEPAPEPPPAAPAAAPGVVVRQDGQTEGAAPPTQENSIQPGSEGTSEPAPEPQPTYSLYRVDYGDTVYSIAQAFGISADYVLWNNADIITEPHLLAVGDELLIPNVDGIIYQAQPGDTLSSIAASYQIDVGSIVAFAPNGLTSTDDNIEGMTLLLPGAVPPSGG